LPQLRAALDLDRPVALLVIAVLHFIADDDEAHTVLGKLVEALPSGSYLAVSTATGDFDPEPLAGVVQAYEANGEVMKLRHQAQVERFFDGLELLEPGVVQAHKWRPDDIARALVKNDADVAMYAGLARKP
jgi:hypothetical protein